jgi:hypothetical protein
VKISFLQEPELEFGAGLRHIDIRFGLMNYGPLDVDSELAPRRIRVGIVGTPATVEGARAWLERCRGEIPPPPDIRQPNFHPRFPGFNPDVAFRSTLVLEDALVRRIPDREFEDFKRLGSSNDLARGAAAAIVDECRELVASHAVDVILCPVPPQLVEIMDPAQRVHKVGGAEPLVNFHHLLKALAMDLRPIQLMLPSTYDSSLARKLKIREGVRRLQDDATRAWNFHAALYYKAHGRPWRLPRDPTRLQTCYVGVSFYYSLDRTTVVTSMAQVFDERGDGVVVRGGPVLVDKQDRSPHLTASDAEALLRDALARYRREHKTLPARLVVHKTSRFNADELEGMRAAAAAERIDTADYLSMDDDSTQRLFRYGAYPPLRGTLLELDSIEQLLYTRGSVDFFATYPGQYIPRPLLFRCDAVEATTRELAVETLSLTKMNWNDTQFDHAAPITLVAARKVGDIMKYVGAERPLADRYSHYM